MDIALALGGGGVKGVAHLGVIRRLVREGYTIRAITGTSAGGLVGALYCSGCSIKEILELVRHFDTSTLYRRQPEDGPSLLGLGGLHKLMSVVLGDRTFDSLKIPFACSAVDTQSGRELYLHSGKVVDALQATIAVPGIFPPKSLGDSVLVDGGVLNPVPVSLARWLAPHLPVIAVVLSPEPQKWTNLPEIHIPTPVSIPTPFIDRLSRLRYAQAFHMFVRSVEISSYMLAELRLKVEKPEVVIRPDVSKYSFLDKVNLEDLTQAGDYAALQALPEIQKTCSWQSRLTRRIRKNTPVFS